MSNGVPTIRKDSIGFIINGLVGRRGVIGSKVAIDGLKLETALGHNLIQIVNKARSIISLMISKLRTRLTVHIPPRLDIRKEHRRGHIRTRARIEGAHIVDNTREVIRLNCLREVG